MSLGPNCRECRVSTGGESLHETRPGHSFWTNGSPHRRPFWTPVGLQNRTSKRSAVRNSLSYLVGPPGFEPGTSCTPSKRASQAAPRPESSITYEETRGICTLAPYVERFKQEREYLKGVSPSTLTWYRHSFQAFGPLLDRAYESQADFKGSVMERIQVLRQQGRGNKAVSINTYLRCFKAFLNWCHQEQI